MRDIESIYIYIYLSYTYYLPRFEQVYILSQPIRWDIATCLPRATSYSDQIPEVCSYENEI